MAFFDLSGAALAIAENHFTQKVLFDRLIMMISDPDPKISMPALREFNKLTRQLAIDNGRIAKASQKQETADASGNTTKRTLSTSVVRTLSSPPPPPATYREFHPPQAAGGSGVRPLPAAPDREAPPHA